MTTKLSFSQALKEAQGFCTQFKEIETRIHTTCYLGRSIFSLFYNMRDGHEKMKSINTEGFSQSEATRFELVYRQCENIYNRNQTNLLQLQKEHVEDLYNELVRYIQLHHTDPTKEIIKQLAIFKSHIDEAQISVKDDKLNGLIANIREIFPSEEWEKVEDAEPLISHSIPCSSVSAISSVPLSQELGFAADRLPEIATTLFTAQPNMEFILRSLTTIPASVKLTIQGSSGKMPVGGLVLYHLHMLQVNEGHPSSHIEENGYIENAFKDLG